MRRLIPALLLLGSTTAVAAEGDLAKGKKIYMANCMACHGRAGAGDGPAAAALKPKPKDFTSAEFWKGRDDAAVKAVIRAGKPGTAMMPFAQLSDAELDAVVVFLRSLAPAGE